jgi:ribosomal-protein-alanine N-acetyltransferase
MLEGKRCFVRPWRVRDAQALARHANNINIARHLRDRFPHPYTIDHAHAFLKVATAEDPPHSLAIEVNGEAAGGIGYVPGSDVERFSAEIGYWLSEHYWGRGITTEALKLVTEDVFRRLNLLRLFALTFADNVGSTRVLEKAGYVCEGMARASSVKYGAPRDRLIYARINDRWESPGPS